MICNLYILTDVLLRIFFFGAILLQYLLHLFVSHKRKEKDGWVALLFCPYMIAFLLGLWAFISAVHVANGGHDAFPDFFGFGGWFGSGGYGLIFSLALLIGLGIGSLAWGITLIVRWCIRGRTV